MHNPFGNMEREAETTLPVDMCPWCGRIALAITDRHNHLGRRCPGVVQHLTYQLVPASRSVVIDRRGSYNIEIPIAD